LIYFLFFLFFYFSYFFIFLIFLIFLILFILFLDDYFDYKLFTIKCYFNSILNENNSKINIYKNLILFSIKDINIIISLLYDYIKLKMNKIYNLFLKNNQTENIQKLDLKKHLI